MARKKKINTKLFMLGKTYIALIKNKDGHWVSYENLDKTSAKIHARSEGYVSEDAFDTVVLGELIIIGGIDRKVDFTMKEASSFECFVNEDRKTWLRITTNPIYDWKEVDESKIDSNIINDYSDISGGLYPVITETIAQLLLCGEGRFNKIAHIATRGTGKSMAYTLMHFTTLSHKDYVKGFGKGESGIGKDQSEHLQTHGLLAIDDIEEVLSEIKSATDTSSVTVKYKGGVDHPTKVIAMTTTDSTVFSTLGDEWTDRLIVFVAPYTDRTIQHSEVYLSDPKKYREHTEAWLKNMLIKELKKEPNPKRLEEIHNQHSLDHVSDMRYTHAIALEKLLRNEEGVFKKLDEGQHSGRYYITTKTPLKEAYKVLLAEAYGLEPADLNAQANRAIDKILEPRQKLFTDVLGYLLTESIEEDVTDQFDDLDPEDL